MLAMLALVLTLAVPSVTLSVTPSEGPAPLTVTSVATVIGPFDGNVCLLITEDMDPVMNPLCKAMTVPDGIGQVVAFDDLTGPEPGTFEFQAFLLVGENDLVGSNVVKVKVTKSEPAD